MTTRPRRSRLPGALLAALMAVTSFVAVNTISSGSAQSQSAPCQGDRKDTTDAAQASFASKCGQAYNDQLRHQCTWVANPNGWICHENSPTPITNSNPPSTQPAGNGGSSGSSSNAPCQGDRKDTTDAAKASFASKCGQAYNDQLRHQCTWVANPNGWICHENSATPITGGSSGTTGGSPSSTTGGSTGANTATTVSTPRFIRAWKTSRYVNVVWTKNTNVDGVNVYRNDKFVKSVSSSGNVFNDYSGGVGDVYELIAYKDGKFSATSAPMTTVSESIAAPPDVIFASRQSSRVVNIAWGFDSGKTSGTFKVLRDGRTIATLRSTSTTSYIDTTADPSRSHKYQIVTVNGTDGRTSVGVDVSANAQPSAVYGSGTFVNATGLIRSAGDVGTSRTNAVISVGALIASVGFSPAGAVARGGAALFGTSGFATNRVTNGDWNPITTSVEQFEADLNDFLAGQRSPYRFPQIALPRVDNPLYVQWQEAASARGAVIDELLSASRACGCRLTDAQARAIVEAEIERFRQRGMLVPHPEGEVDGTSLPFAPVKIRIPKGGTCGSANGCEVWGVPGRRSGTVDIPKSEHCPSPSGCSYYADGTPATQSTSTGTTGGNSTSSDTGNSTGSNTGQVSTSGTYPGSDPPATGQVSTSGTYPGSDPP